MKLDYLLRRLPRTSRAGSREKRPISPGRSRQINVDQRTLNRALAGVLGVIRSGPTQMAGVLRIQNIPNRPIDAPVVLIVDRPAKLRPRNISQSIVGLPNNRPSPRTPLNKLAENKRPNPQPLSSIRDVAVALSQSRANLIRGKGIIIRPLGPKIRREHDPVFYQDFQLMRNIDWNDTYYVLVPVDCVWS